MCSAQLTPPLPLQAVFPNSPLGCDLNASPDITLTVVPNGGVAFVGFPIAVAWDIGTFPFQLIGGAYPYGDSTMQPGDDTDL